MKFSIWPIVAMYAEVCDYFWKFLTILGAIFTDKMRRQVFDLTKSIQKSYRDIIAIDLLHEAKVKEQREQVSRFFYHLFWYNSAAIYPRMLHFFQLWFGFMVVAIWFYNPLRKYNFNCSTYLEVLWADSSVYINKTFCCFKCILLLIICKITWLELALRRQLRLTSLGFY